LAGDDAVAAQERGDDVWLPQVADDHGPVVEIARILHEEGYIDAFAVSKGDVHDTLVVTLRYGPSRERVISGLKRVSRPGRRVYAKKDRPHRVLGGMGVAILSTSRGVVTGRQAQEQGVGGEVVCYVW